MQTQELPAPPAPSQPEQWAPGREAWLRWYVAERREPAREVVTVLQRAEAARLRTQAVRARTDTVVMRGALTADRRQPGLDTP